MKKIQLIIGLLFIQTVLTFAQNLIQNPSFETGNISPWTTWTPINVNDISIVNQNGTAGSHAIQVKGRQAGLEQLVSGLKPNTTYIFSAKIKCNAGASIWLGAKNYGGNEVHQTADATTFKQYDLQFKTGSNNTQATVYFYRHPDEGNTDLVWGDEFQLIAYATNAEIDLGINKVPLRVYENPNQFALKVFPKITNGNVSSNFKLYYYWKDFFGNVQSKIELKLNQENNIQAPNITAKQQFFSLIFESNDPTLLFPQRKRAGLAREYGICFLKKIPASEKKASNDYPLGMVHLFNQDDPFMAAQLIKTLESPAINPTQFGIESKKSQQKGFQEVMLISRADAAWAGAKVRWNTNAKPIAGDNEAVTSAYLQYLEQQMEAYFRANPSVLYYELGLEENLDFKGWVNQPYYWSNLAKKAEVCKRAAQRVNPNIKLCYQVEGAYAQRVLPFLQNEASKFFDIVSLHPYRWSNFPTPETWLVNEIQQTLQYIKQYRPQLALWFTEIGAPNDTDVSAKFYHQSMQESATFMAKTIVLSFANQVKKVIWYNYFDRCSDHTDVECQFGMLDYWGFPRASYATYYTLLKTIRDKSFKRQIDLGDKNLYAFEFEGNNGEKTIVAWMYGAQSKKVTLKSLSSKLNAKKIINVLATEGTPLNIVKNNNITIPDYPIFISYKDTQVTTTTQLSETAPTKPQKELLIYPNPSSDFVQLDMQFDAIETLKIEVFNSVGQVVKTQDIMTDYLNATLDVQNLPNGTYWIAIKSNQQHWTKAVIIQH